MLCVQSCSPCGRGTLLLAVTSTMARYCSIELLLHRQRLAQTGTSANSHQERQANDARACRLVINRRNVILTAPGMQAQNTGLPQPIAQTTTCIWCVIIKTITENFPPTRVGRIVVYGPETIDGFRCCLVANTIEICLSLAAAALPRSPLLFAWIWRLIQWAVCLALAVPYIHVL